MQEVFKDATGFSYPEMQKQLERYVRNGRYGARVLPRSKLPPPESYQMNRVPRDEIRERLAELALRTRRDPLAKLAMLEAASGPRGVRALEALGSDALSEGDDRVAQLRWEGAIAAGSRNPAVFHQVGMMEGRRWFSEFDYYFRFPEAKAAQLRRLLERSIAFAPQQSDAYEMLAWVEASAPTPSIANINLVQDRFQKLEDKPGTLLALALVRLRLDDHATGEKLLVEVEKLQPDYRTLHAVETVRAILEGRPPQRLSKPEPAPFRPQLNLRPGALNP